MLSIQTNIAALSAQNALTTTTNNLQKSMERLSSGFRINHAADDAAGLAISEKMQAQIGGLNQAVRNANDGASLIQTAEGALDQVQTMMIRMRNLAVQGASDTTGPQERADINVELQQLKSEIDNISKRTSFNGLGLLDGSLAATAATGTGTGNLATFETTVATALTTATTPGTVTGVDMGGDAEPAGTAYTFAYDNTTKVLTATSSYVPTGGHAATDVATLTDIAANGSAIFTFANLGISIGMTAGAQGVTADAAGAALAAGTIASSATAHSAVLQTGADATAANTTSVGLLDTRLLGGTSAEMGLLANRLAQYNTDAGTTAGATDLDATNLIKAVDTANAWISSQRAQLGAAQNRLGYAAASLTTTSQNVSAANSQIRDVDVAAETSQMSKSQILEQAGVSVLAQANQVQQLALKLLG
jgi:flagellin